MKKRHETIGTKMIERFYDENREVDPETVSRTKQMTVKLSIEVASSLQGIAKAFFTDFSSLAEEILTAEFYAMAAVLEEPEMREASETARKLEIDFYKSKGFEIEKMHIDVPLVEHVWNAARKNEGEKS